VECARTTGERQRAPMRGNSDGVGSANLVQLPASTAHEIKQPISAVIANTDERGSKKGADRTHMGSLLIDKRSHLLIWPRFVDLLLLRSSLRRGHSDVCPALRRAGIKSLGTRNS
jgi:hypothetical protein